MLLYTTVVTIKVKSILGGGGGYHSLLFTIF